jgi:hypothetical protein
MWFDDKFAALDLETRYLFLYLITNPHTHVSGIYYLPFPTILHETKLNETQLRYGMDTLSIGHLAFFDDRFCVIFVTHFLEYQGHGKKNDVAAANQLQQLHRSPLIDKFLEQYPRIRKLVRKPKKGYPIDTTSKVGPQEQEQDSSLSSSSLSLISSSLNTSELRAETVRDLWHAAKLRPCQKLSGHVLQVLKARIREHPTVEWWQDLFTRVAASDFLGGRKTDFVATLDWVCGPKNLSKILAGNYDNGRQQDGLTRLADSFLREVHCDT